MKQKERKIGKKEKRGRKIGRKKRNDNNNKRRNIMRGNLAIHNTC